MKNIYDITLFIILYVILFFSLLGCPPDPPIDPPDIDLIALVIDTNVEVSWDTVEDGI